MRDFKVSMSSEKNKNILTIRHPSSLDKGLPPKCLGVSLTKGKVGLLTIFVIMVVVPEWYILKPIL